MPKRIIDGEALWTSSKLAQVQPESYRAEYSGLLPLAMANGSFECDPRLVWAKVYAANRPSITQGDVVAILSEFERVKLLFRFSHDGKEWGFWVGIDKPGRLPKPSDVAAKRYECGAPIPKEKLLQFLTGNDVALISPHDGDSGANGIGIGIGIGLVWEGKDSQQKNLTTHQNFNPMEIAQIISQKNGWSGKDMIWAFQSAIEFQAQRMPEAELEQVGEWLTKAYRDHQAAKGTFAVGPRKFFEQGLYATAPDRQEAKANVLVDNPATRALAQLEASQ
jgi:hypothetical protein